MIPLFIKVVVTITVASGMIGILGEVGDNEELEVVGILGFFGSFFASLIYVLIWMWQL